MSKTWWYILGGLAVLALAYWFEQGGDLSAITDFFSGSGDGSVSDEAVDPNTLSLSAEAAATLESEEGDSLTAYKDANGYSIGYGHYGASAGETESQSQADSDFWADVAKAEAFVQNNVTVPLTQGQFDALVDFVYNVGGTAFAGSALLQDIDAGNFEDAANQFGAWIYTTVGGVKQVASALITRRATETSEFTEGSTS